MNTRVGELRDVGGRIVREAWVRWARQQPNPKPSWLAPYDELSEADKEADRQIYEACALATHAATVPVAKVLENEHGGSDVGWLVHPAPADGTYLYATPTLAAQQAGDKT